MSTLRLIGMTFSLMFLCLTCSFGCNQHLRASATRSEPTLARKHAVVTTMPVPSSTELTNLEVQCAYFEPLTDDKYYVGFVDPKRKLFYLWKDVVLPYHLVPGQGVISGVSIHVLGEDHLTPIPVTPPVMYLDLDERYAAPGFLDASCHVFYRFRGITVRRELVPPSDSKLYEFREPLGPLYPVVEIDMPPDVKLPIVRIGSAERIKPEKGK